MSIFKFVLVLLLLLLPGHQRWTTAALFYPSSSVLQVTGSVSVPVRDFPSFGSIFFDWGLQVNYNLPVNVSSFYNVPTFPQLYGVKFDKRELNQQDFREGLRIKQTLEDITALQMYKAIEETLNSFSFHESCLRQSICALASNPFADPQENTLSSILYFLLTPSLHAEYSRANEVGEQRKYQQAEYYGNLEMACTKLYPDCTANVLDFITKLL